MIHCMYFSLWKLQPYCSSQHFSGREREGKYCVLQKSYVSLSASVSQIQDGNLLPDVSLVINGTF